MASVTLIVIGEDLEPDVVTADLGWSPSQSWRRGERKRIPLPDGSERVFESIHDWGGWKLFSTPDDHKSPLQEQIVAWLERLRSKQQALRNLYDRGWEIELNCFAATSECLDLPASMLSELVAMRVGLNFTFSP